jgi:transcription initiation factor TFIIB
MMMNGAGRVLSPGEVVDETEDVPVVEAEYRPQLAIKLICPECQVDPPNLVEE